MDLVKLADALPPGVFKLSGFEPDTGCAFRAAAPCAGDSTEDPFLSPMLLLEDGVPLGPGHSQHADIRDLGRGRFSHWGEAIYFSTSDGSDPRSNGRSYFAVHVARTVNSAKRAALAAIEALPDDFESSQAYAAIETAMLSLYPGAMIGEDQKLFWRRADFLDNYLRLAGANRRSLERKFTVDQLLRSLDHLDGDVAECGVYNGCTAFFMGQAGRPMHLFDSFEGLSVPSALDGSYWTAGDLNVSEAVARDNLRNINATLYKGWIPERFAEVAERTFCFLHIDVDLYAPTRDSIEFFYPRVVRGGMIVCDDYGFATCPGAARAIDEFMAGKPERLIHLPTGQGLVIKR